MVAREALTLRAVVRFHLPQPLSADNPARKVILSHLMRIAKFSSGAEIILLEIGIMVLRTALTRLTEVRFLHLQPTLAELFTASLPEGKSRG